MTATSHDASELRAALRAGTLERWRVELAALCGHDAAARVVGASPPPREHVKWFRALGACHEQACLAARVVECDATYGDCARGPWAWGESLADGVLFVTFDRPDPELRREVEQGRQRSADPPGGGDPSGTSIRSGRCSVSRLFLRSAASCIPAWATKHPLSLSGTPPPEELRPRLEARLSEWALRPLLGPSRAPFDLDVLAAPRTWWEGPPPWEAPVEPRPEPEEVDLDDPTALRAAIGGFMSNYLQVRLAAFCGHQAAAQVAKLAPPPQDPARWFVELGWRERRTCMAARVALAALDVPPAPFAPYAWADIHGDWLVVAFFAASGLRPDHVQQLLALPPAGPCGDGLDEGVFLVDHDAQVVGMRFDHRDEPGRGAPLVRDDASRRLPLEELRRHVAERLAAWALGPMRHRRSSALLGLDALVAPRTWWEGPPPWEGPTVTPPATDGAPS